MQRGITLVKPSWITNNKGNQLKTPKLTELYNGLVSESEPIKVCETKNLYQLHYIFRSLLFFLVLTVGFNFVIIYFQKRKIAVRRKADSIDYDSEGESICEVPATGDKTMR